jgi:putative flippase GtrA
MRIFIRYFTSGVIATISHFAILILLVELFFINPLVATVVGFVVAIAVNYLLQYHWTFRCCGPLAYIFVRYLIVTLLMLLLNTALFWVLCYYYTIPYIVAQALVTSIVFLCNYSVNRRYTFVYSCPK